MALTSVSEGDLDCDSNDPERFNYIGRWDTPQHVLVDDMEVGPETSEIWPGMSHVYANEMTADVRQQRQGLQ